MSGDESTYRVRRCSTCGINYADFDEFAVCARCEEEIPRVDIKRHYPTDRAPSPAESRAKVMNIRAAQAAELEAEALEREEALAPVISAATACLNYDLDRWESEGADWIADLGADEAAA